MISKALIWPSFGDALSRRSQSPLATQDETRRTSGLPGFSTLVLPTLYYPLVPLYFSLLSFWDNDPGLAAVMWQFDSHLPFIALTFL